MDKQKTLYSPLIDWNRFRNNKKEKGFEDCSYEIPFLFPHFANVIITSDKIIPLYKLKDGEQLYADFVQNNEKKHWQNCKGLQKKLKVIFNLKKPIRFWKYLLAREIKEILSDSNLHYDEPIDVELIINYVEKGYRKFYFHKNGKFNREMYTKVMIFDCVCCSFWDK